MPYSFSTFIFFIFLAFGIQAEAKSKPEVFYPTAEVAVANPIPLDLDLMAYEEVQRCVACVFRAGGFGHHDFEAAAFITVEKGQPRCSLWPMSREAGKQSFKGVLPENIIAIIHTHPTLRGGRASDIDEETSRKMKIPNYIIHGERGVAEFNPLRGESIRVRDPQFIYDTVKTFGSCRFQ